MSKRPTNIGMNSLIHYRFPMTAITSILHRASGVLLFIAVPFLIWIFAISLQSQQGFLQVQSYFNCDWIRFLVWVFYAALIYHLIAGIRHLFADMGLFEGKTSGKVASTIVVVLSLILIILAGVWML